MKIINLISISLEHLIDLTLNNLSIENSPLEIDSISQIHLTIINKIMSTHKKSNSLPHGLNIQIILSKKVLVRSLSTPIPGIEVIANLLTSQNTDILGEDCV